MAGGRNLGGTSDNPVAINATAMVDVIFCHCIFFRCSIHFKQIEGKVEIWAAILKLREDYRKSGFSVLIDALPDVPWEDVVHVVDLCRKEKIEQVPFVASFEGKARGAETWR